MGYAITQQYEEVVELNGLKKVTKLPYQLHIIFEILKYSVKSLFTFLYKILTRVGERRF